MEVVRDCKRQRKGDMGGRDGNTDEGHIAHVKIVSEQTKSMSFERQVNLFPTTFLLVSTSRPFYEGGDLQPRSKITHFYHHCYR